jgi:hypothetical protein
VEECQEVIHDVSLALDRELVGQFVLIEIAQEVEIDNRLRGEDR